MNQPFNPSFAVNGVPCNPVNELLAGIMRSFGEEPSAQNTRDNVSPTWTSGSEQGNATTLSQKSANRARKS